MSMVDNPDASVADMSLLAEQGLAAIQGWNGPFPLPHESCVHTLIDEQARCIPEASAISSFEGNLSYGELEDLSNRLAQHLVLAGVKLEHIVPLCFDKSTCAVVSMLAVLKAGGACLSMSPTSPARYLRGTLAEVQASIILVAPQHADLFRGIGVRMLIIDNGSILNLPPFRQQPSVLPRVNPTNAAFVVCTSGSTATPKKIVLEHAAVVTSSQAHGSVMGITASSRVLQFSAYTFDVSIQDIFTTWQRGGCVCIISDHERLNDLAGAINARQANFADFTPTVAALIQPSTVPCLKTISVGGEAVPRSLNELWEPYARVINMYGPAEVTINTAYTDQGGRDRDDCQAALIGRPLASWFWVINSNEPDRLVPIGCVGELLIEGPLLAREYLNDVQKTEAAFIINPKWSSLSSPDKKPVAKRRMYRTGDLVRLNHNGTYTYIGRKDRQVKLYGQRVELGEIEHQLMQLVPNDVRVVVEAIGAPLNGEKQRTRLVAFLEWSSPSFSEDDKGDRRPDDTLLPVDNDEIVKLLSWLRESLQELLPPYMLPSLYVPLRNFPTTASGKLDRKRLSDFVEVSLGDKSQMSVIREKLAPMTDAQKTIHALIASLLSLSPGAFGINDSFFTLGGDSVDAIMLAQEARQQGLRISVADILRHPRIHEMAQLGEVVLA